jgi:hypothetical protein
LRDGLPIAALVAGSNRRLPDKRGGVRQGSYSVGGEASFTGQKGLRRTWASRPENRLKAVDPQIFMQKSADCLHPTRTPHFEHSIAGECDFRETAFFGFCCMVGHRAEDAPGIL